MCMCVFMCVYVCVCVCETVYLCVFYVFVCIRNIMQYVYENICERVTVVCHALREGSKKIVV